MKQLHDYGRAGQAVPGGQIGQQLKYRAARIIDFAAFHRTAAVQHYHQVDIAGFRLVRRGDLIRLQREVQAHGTGRSQKHFVLYEVTGNAEDSIAYSLQRGCAGLRVLRENTRYFVRIRHGRPSNCNQQNNQ